MAQDEGINFPLAHDGKRSTTAVGKHAVAAAVGAIDEGLAAAVHGERSWHKQYPRHYLGLEKVGLASPQAAEAVASAGLDALYREMVFVRDGKTLAIDEAMVGELEIDLCSVTLHGNDRSAPKALSIPYRGESLTGEALSKQIDDWEARDIIEPSCGSALRRVQAHPEWLDLSDQTIVLLGAASEMGPFKVLCRWRANIVAVDLDRPSIWEGLIGTARAGNGTLTLPLRCEFSAAGDDAGLAHRAGADLITRTPEIAAWLGQLEGPLVIGGYAYLDGGPHVRVALAMDAIMRQLAAARNDVTLALLPTPSDVMAVPGEAAEEARSKYRQRTAQRLWQEPIRATSGDRCYAPNVTDLLPLAQDKQVGIVDSLMIQQGPNYALAKRLQRWRAVLARSQGVRVSSNVAPGTRTASVVHNLALASAHHGAGHFGVESFESATSNALMAALLVHDLRYEQSAANPAVALDHPAELFMEGAAHGGLWRAAFRPRSVIGIAAFLGWRAAHQERQAS